ncbi:MAG TPA: transglycosylase SLT domain-containing protein [Candidatus Limnocylindrales bacterium]|nr:transglycosylase SLT domain-containing protein [Candidatus Limnocylindrales bacterium]
MLRYWRWRDRLSRRAAALSRVSGLSAVSHGTVLALGLMLVLPALPKAPRSAAQPTVAARSLALPMAFDGTLRASLVSSEAAIERREVPPPPPPPAAPARVAAPAAKPAFQPPPPGSGGSGLAAIYAVFNGSPGLTWALRVANCESHYNPLAVNRASGASGLFQFMPSTWNANFPGWNIWDPMAQARAALTFYNAGRQSAWTCK